ncbi:MAG: type II toxin-antitoxin system YafQ family toxin [Patescibacteria group bacterium]|nr:type II toxin-antitoxin system YafQ family toxin [Patescibacteria group bacterium]
MFSDCREVHLFPDILLIYKVIGESYVLVDIGSHSDLF